MPFYKLQIKHFADSLDFLFYRALLRFFHDYILDDKNTLARNFHFRFSFFFPPFRFDFFAHNSKTSF